MAEGRTTWLTDQIFEYVALWVVLVRPHFFRTNFRLTTGVVSLLWRCPTCIWSWLQMSQRLWCVLFIFNLNWEVSICSEVPFCLCRKHQRVEPTMFFDTETKNFATKKIWMPHELFDHNFEPDWSAVPNLIFSRLVWLVFHIPQVCTALNVPKFVQETPKDLMNSIWCTVFSRKKSYSFIWWALWAPQT